jgi:hypothetical protein
VDALGAQLKKTECVTGARPVPESATVNGEFVALLVTMMLPVALPAVAGLSVPLCPGERMTPASPPPALNPAPETLTFEMVTLEFPVLVRITFCVLLLDRFMLPNAKLVALLFKRKVAALTVRLAALLVALPALLLTTAVNCIPLYEVVAAEIV